MEVGLQHNLQATCLSCRAQAATMKTVYRNLALIGLPIILP